VKEFGSNKGSVLLIVRALYSLKTSGTAWQVTFAQKLNDMGYRSTRADPNVLIRQAITSKQFTTYFPILSHMRTCVLFLTWHIPILMTGISILPIGWDFYPNATDGLPPNRLEPNDFPLMIHVLYTGHAGNLATCHSQTSILIINKAPIIWYSKQQNTVESSTFGSKFYTLCIITNLIVSLHYNY